MKEKHFLLDMDGVLSDFFTSAIKLFNHKCGKDFSVRQWHEEQLGYDMEKVYGLTMQQFWNIIDNDLDFWIGLEPFPWTQRLYCALKNLGEVTIVTSPSLNYQCSAEKLQWLDNYLDIKANEVFLGSRKYLMAGNGVMIDDLPKNVEKFRMHGGQAILVPSTWNTPDLDFDKVWGTIVKAL